MKIPSKIPAMLVGALAMLAVMLVLQSPASTNAQAGDHYFSETGHNVPSIFYQYWLSHGGLAQQGYPITDATMEKNSIDGKDYLTQYFERARFEHHLEFKGTANEVLLGLLGVEVLKCRTTTSGSASAKDASGTSDFKFIPRPANAYIKSWCVTPTCSDAIIAAGGGGGKDATEDFISIAYHTANDTNFDKETVNRFYVDTLTKAGWTLGPPPGAGDNQGQVFFPPNNLKDKVKRAAIWFANPPNNLVIAVVRTTPIGNPPDLSLFQGH